MFFFQDKCGLEEYYKWEDDLLDGDKGGDTQGNEALSPARRKSESLRN